MTPPKIHELKTFTQFFQPILDGYKTFEIRLNDRDFHVGDLIILSEIDPDNCLDTGRKSAFRITYILTSDDFHGISHGYVCMSIIPYIIPEVRTAIFAYSATA
jgi:hypothetical protein